MCRPAGYLAYGITHALVYSLAVLLAAGLAGIVDEDRLARGLPDPRERGRRREQVDWEAIGPPDATEDLGDLLAPRYES